MKRQRIGNYRGIVFAIALFIVLDAAVLSLNFYMASQFTLDAELVNLSARQQTLSQQTVKALLQTDNALSSGDVIDEQLAEFKRSFGMFDETLDAFLNGGAVTAADGSRRAIRALDDPALVTELRATEQVWAPFVDRIRPIIAFEGEVVADADFVVGDEEEQLQSAMYEAIVFSAQDNTSAKLLEHINRVTVGLENQAAARANLLRVVQIAGIGLALAMFLIIVFYFLRNLRASDDARADAEREKDEILDTVSDGLFLLDANLNFGSQYSRSVESMFRREKLGGQSFLEVLRDIVPEKTLEIVQDYVELFFGGRVNEKLVDDLNPLDRVEVHFKNHAGGFVTRYLGFSFKRVLVDDALSHLLVTVNDTTEMVALKRLLSQSQDQSGSQFDILMSVLHIEPDMLRDFLESADQNTVAINEILKRPGSSQADCVSKLDGIFRHVHALKGEAAAVGLASIAESAHTLEDCAVSMKENRALTGRDFLPLTMRLDELYSQLQSVRKLIDKLVKFRGTMDAAPSAPMQNDDNRRVQRTEVQGLLTNLAERVAEEQGKKVELVCHGFDMLDIPGHVRKAVKDIAVQFVRNGIVHGIEVPSERLGAQKAQQGRVFLNFQKNKDGYYELTYRDDGRGLVVSSIREAALSRGFVSADQIDSMNDRQVMSLIFKRGFSTSVTADGNAGRGVGMDIVRHLVHELGGRFKMSTSEGKYTAFVVVVPAQQGGAVQAA